MIKHHCLAVVFLSALAGNAVAAELRGQVLQADGKPAVGAKVWAAAVFVSPPVRKETRTDKKGEFRLELEPLWPFGQWSVLASSGRQGGEANDRYGTVKLVEGRELEPVTIQLEERGVLRGQVVEDESGKPIAGARVFMDSGEIITTNEAGRYEVGGLRLEDHTLLVVSTGRERRHVLFDTTLRPDAELNIRLPRAALIRGRILDEEGKPIPGAYVQRRASGNALTLNGWVQACDAGGRFAFEVPFNRLIYSIGFSAPEHAYQERTMILVRESAEPEWVIQLKQLPPEELAAMKAEKPKPRPPEHPRRELTGRVFLDLNKPLADVIVRWGTTEAESLKRETKTDKRGNFTLKDVPDRDGLLLVIPPENAPQFADALKGQANVVVRVEVGQVAAGLVRGWDGRPLAGVLVVPELLTSDHQLAMPALLNERAVVTDNAGAFQFRGLPTAVRFHFQAEGLNHLVSYRLQLGANNNLVEMTPERGAIRGRVLDPEGKPARNFRIRMQQPRMQRPNEKAGGYYVGYGSLGISFTTDDGVFIVSDIGEPGAVVRVCAIAEGYGQAVVDRTAVYPVDELPPPDGLTLRLTKPHSLRVRVVDARNGNPLPNAAVTLIDGDLELDKKFLWGYNDLGERSLRSDKEGVVSFPALAFGEATVLVQCPGFGRARLAWRRGEKGISVRLVEQAVIDGVLRLPAQPKPFETWSILESDGGDTYSARVDPANGLFRFEQLPAGAYHLRTPSRRNAPEPIAITLKAGERRQATVVAGEIEAKKP